MEMFNRQLPPNMAQYSPHRDLGMIGLELLQIAAAESSPAHLEQLPADLQQLHQQLGVDGAQLVAAYTALGKAIESYLNADCENPRQALTAAGYFQLPEGTRLVVQAKLGQVLLRTYFTCLRDIMEATPATVAIRAKLLQTIKQLELDFQEQRDAP